MFLPTSGYIVFSLVWTEQWTNFIWWFHELSDKNMTVDWAVTDCCLGVKYQESRCWVPWEKNILLPTVVSCATVTREKYYRPACTLSLVQLRTSPSCFISTLLLALWLCAQPRILGAFMVQGWAGGPMGRDPFDTLESDIVIWNFFPCSVRHACSLSFFKSKLKTHLLSSAYWFAFLSSLFH